jgi:hypothetical protein
VTWHPHRLPISAPPLAGEALDSWLEAYARRLRSCSRDLLDHLGLTGSTLAHMVITLTDREREILTAVTGVDPDALRRMTLAPWNAIAVTIHPDRRRVEHPPAWRRHTGSRFCPTCLAGNDGRWLLRWRLPWAFACPTHACLLVDHCPGCGKRPHPDRPGTRTNATIPGQCTTALPTHTPGGWRAPTCGHSLTEAPTISLPANGLVLAGQRRVDHLLRAATHTDDPARRQRIRGTLDELHTLAYKSLRALHNCAAELPEHARTVLHECGGTVPAARDALDSYDAHTIAVATAIATIAHRDTPTGQTILSWIITADHRRIGHAEPGLIVKPWRTANPRLIERVLTVLDPHLRAQHRLTYRTAGRHPHRPDATPEQIRVRTASLPALIWPAWAIRLIPATNNGYNALPGTTAALAALSLIPGSRLTQQQAVELLGWHHQPSVKTVLTRQPAQQCTNLLAILDELATLLDTAPAPIDYTRRRALFAHPTIDRRGYRKLAAGHGWHPPSPLQLQILDDHLAVLLTGTRPVQHDRSNRSDAWNPHTAALPAIARAFVLQQAHRLLHRHRVIEPVSWHPTPPPDLPWPGIDPTTIDPDRVARALATYGANRNGLQRISDATGLTNVHVRLYTQLVDLPMPDQQWNDLATRCTHDNRDPAMLQHLYHDQKLSMMEIARLSLTTESEVRDALIAAGTIPKPNRQQAKPVSREWIEQHYLNTGKPLWQAAIDAGVSRNTFAKYARQHGISTQLNASAINPFATWRASQQPPANVIAACSSPHGLQYLREVLAMPSHPTRRAAAAALGLHEAVLCHHRQHIEQLAGIQIFQPDQPLTPTAAGAQFLRHAAQAIRKLDRSTSGNS